jgi:hypothetical protein
MTIQIEFGGSAGIVEICNIASNKYLEKIFSTARETKRIYICINN